MNNPPKNDTPDKALVEALRECDWPEGGRFTFHDEPGEHDPCYVVMPGGAALALNHHAGEGVDIARAKFIIAACNAALASNSPVVGEDAPVIPADMKPWHGGGSAPEDWDGGAVMLRNGSTMFPSRVSLAYHANGTARWNHRRDNRNPEWDIIAYTPKPTPTDTTDAFREDNGDKDGRTPVEGPTDTAYRARAPMRKAYQFLDEARVFPIPLREDVTVRIVDLPHDLTRAEAEKIGRIVMALTPVEIGSHFGNGGAFDPSGGEG